MKYRKKPIEVEAWQWNGEDGRHWPQWMHDYNFNDEVCYGFEGKLSIPTLEGRMKATPTDWIIKGIAGELYPCKHDIFIATYEAVE